MNSIVRSSLVVAFAAGAFFVSSAAFARGGELPAQPRTASQSLAGSQNPFRLIDPGSPEYVALARLTRAGLVKQHAFLIAPGRPLTRYQAALVAAEAINNAKALMHAGESAQLSADDITALQVVYDSVKDDLTTLTARVDADERRIAALEQSRQEQPTGRRDPPEDAGFKPSFELHGEFRIRPIAALDQSGSGLAPSGTPLAPGTTMVRTGMAGDAAVTAGSTGLGQMQSRLRLVGVGHVNPRADFIVRLSTEDTGGANNASLAHNDFSFVQYHVPNSPLSFYGGKLLYCCGTPWLPDGTGLIADAVPIGVAVKWTHPGENPHGMSAWLSVGSLKNAETAPTQVPCPPANIGLTQNILAGHAEYAFTPAWSLQGQFIEEPAQCVTAFRNGQLLSTSTNLQVASFTLSHQFSALFSAVFEGLRRFGTDPNTGTGWTDNNALYLGVRYGKFGQAYASGLDATYIDTGKNSVLGNLDSIVNGVDSPWNFTLPYANNVRTFDLGYSWFFDAQTALRLEYATAMLRAAERDTVGDLIQSDRRSFLILTGTFNF